MTTCVWRFQYLIWISVNLVAGLSGAAETSVLDGFRPIFNGRDLDGWEGDPVYWSVEDGAIVGHSTAENRLNKPNSSYLVWTGGEVADFELRVKFHIERGNSGIQYRSRRLTDGQVAGYQADIQAARREVTGTLHEQAGRQVLARHGQRVVIDRDGKRRSIDVYGNAETLMNLFRRGEWNEYTITARGPEITHWLNGQVVLQVVDQQQGKAQPRGILAFQLHWGAPMTIRFKDVRLRVLSDADAPRMHFADTASGRPFSKDPAVVRFQERYWLYYSLPPYDGKSTPGWSIGVATSDNLVDWTKVGALSNVGEAERNGFCAPGAIVLDGKVHLFYQTYGNRRRDAICHAWSDDGLHFTRNPTNPIFRPTGDWNCGRAIDADVIEDGGRLLLYWATRDPEFNIQSQGVAAAPSDSDFARDKWTQLNPDGPILKPELPWEGRCIEAAAMARRGGRLYMFYAGSYNNAPQQVGVAVSDDGIHFERVFDEPFLPNGPPGSWNSSESGHPFLFQDDDGQDYLFYQGNHDKGRSWYLSVLPIDWTDGKPVLAPHKLPCR